MRIPTSEELAELSGRITAQEGEYLKSLASQIPLGGTIVEIGSYRGKSTCYLGTGLLISGNTSAHVQAIDLWTKGNTTSTKYHTEETWFMFNKQVEDMGLKDIITPYMNSSVDAAIRHKHKIDMLFIDGNHKYPYVLADWNAWRKFLKSGSIVAFHDYTPKYRGPVKVVNNKVISKYKLENINITGRLWSARIV